MRLNEIDYWSLNRRDKIIYWLCNVIVTFITVVEMILL